VEYAKTPCSEFPNDNQDLHDGHAAPWYAADEDETGLDLIEIVDELTFDVDPEDEPAPAQPRDPFLSFACVLEQAARSFGGAEESVALLRAMLGITRMEGVSAEASALAALVGAGLASRASDGIARSDEFTRQAVAWQDILREKSDDFAATGGAPLDAWASSLVALVLGGTHQPDTVRRELRRCGVAAFGLVAAA
jgi:hypothetical protein